MRSVGAASRLRGLRLGRGDTALVCFLVLVVSGYASAQLLVTAPVSGTHVEGETVDITWVSGESGTVDIELMDGASVDSLLFDDVAHDSSPQSWLVPGSLTGSNFAIRVTGDNATHTGGTFTIEPRTLSSVSFSSGPVFQHDSETVTWNQQNVDTVSILLRQGSSTVATIATGVTASLETYTFDVPTGSTGGGHRIRVEDEGGIASLAQSMETIEFDWNGDITSVDIELLDTGNTVEQVIETGLSVSGSSHTYTTWNVPAGLDLGTYNVRVRDAGPSSASDEGPDLDIVDADSISITAPVQGATVLPGDDLTIEWSYTGTLTSVDILLYDAAGTTLVQTLAVARAAGNSPFLWSVPDDFATASYTIRIEDDANASTNDVSETFAVVPPKKPTDQAPGTGIPPLYFYIGGGIAGGAVLLGILAVSVVSRRNADDGPVTKSTVNTVRGGTSLAEIIEAEEGKKTGKGKKKPKASPTPVSKEEQGFASAAKAGAGSKRSKPKDGGSAGSKGSKGSKGSARRKIGSGGAAAGGSAGSRATPGVKSALKQSSKRDGPTLFNPADEVDPSGFSLRGDKDQGPTQAEAAAASGLFVPSNAGANATGPGIKQVHRKTGGKGGIPRKAPGGGSKGSRGGGSKGSRRKAQAGSAGSSGSRRRRSNSPVKGARSESAKRVAFAEDK